MEKMENGDKLSGRMNTTWRDWCRRKNNIEMNLTETGQENCEMD
jgi:hypothetical protein